MQPKETQVGRKCNRTRASYLSVSYSERDLDQWMSELIVIAAQLKANNSLPPTVQKHKRTTFLFTLLGFITIFMVPSAVPWLPSLRRNAFTEIQGPIELTSGGRIALHTGPTSSLGSFRLNQVYSEGVHTVRIFVEKLTLSPSSNTYIGLVERAEQSLSLSSGWFITDQRPSPTDTMMTRIIQNLKQ